MKASADGADSEVEEVTTALARWVPVMKTSYDSWLGVMPDGRLGVGKYDEGRVSLEESNWVVAWPLLGLDLERCLAELQNSWPALGDHGVPNPERFVELLAGSACRRGRPYWM
jgi:hypothetical protein